MTQPDNQYEISYRRIVEGDAEAMHKLSLAVRWPHRLEDWKFIMRLGSGYVAEDQSGVVGSAMCWSDGPEFGSIGMVIVDPDRQGNGIGRRLMSMVLAELGNRNIMLNATVSGHELYRKLGFQPVGEIRQHQGTVFQSKLIELAQGERVRPLGSRDAAALVTLAERAVGMPRGTVLYALFDEAKGVVIEHDNEVIGFALLRRFGHGYALGPVIAPDVERAKALISHWAGSYGDSFLRIDVPSNSGLSEWLNEIGLVQVDTVVSMVLGDAPLGAAQPRQFAVINQAIG